MAKASLSTFVARLAIVLSLSACAAGYGQNDRPAWDPPERFQGDFPGRLVELSMSQPMIRDLCAAMLTQEPSRHQRGCARVVGDTCVIAYINAPYGRATPEAVRRHEIGHCNGWSGDHPD